MAQYLFLCSKHGEITLDIPMKDVKDEMKCPDCGNDIHRIYSPVGNVWKCSGAYGKSSSN